MVVDGYILTPKKQKSMETVFNIFEDVEIIVPEIHPFHGAYGIFSDRTPEGKIVVVFNEEFAKAFGGRRKYYKSDQRMEFFPSEVRKIDLSARPELKAKRKFGDSYDKLETLDYKFSPHNECMYRDCKEKASRRILFKWYDEDPNTHRITKVVREFDMCESHAEFDGWSRMLSIKENYEATVREPRK